MTKWVTKKLGECCEINPHNTTNLPEGFYYIDLESVVSGKLIKNQYFSRKEAPSRAQRIVLNNDILYQTVRPYQKNNYIFKYNNDSYVASTGYALLRAKENIEASYIYYIVHTHEFVSTVLGLCTGTSYPAIAPGLLHKIEIPIPALPDGTPDLTEQRRIAGILSSADGAIAASEALIAKYRNIKRGLLTTLLQPKEGWKTGTLKDCTLKITDGCHNKPKCVERSSFIMLSSQNIQDNKLDLKDVSYLTEEDFERENARTNVKAGDVLLTIVGTVGRTYLVKETDFRFTLQRSVAVLSPNIQLIESEFLLYYLNHSISLLENEAHGCAQKGIYLKQLGDMPISYPKDRTEQKRIASILSSIDAKIDAEMAVVEKYKGVKKGLMERMMKY